MAKEVEFERRRSPRKQVDFVALLKLGQAHQGRGHTKDVSARGIGLECPSLFARIPHQRALSLYMGIQIKIGFPNESLTVEGKVVRVEPAKNELGILIVNTTDDEAWARICRETATG